MQILNICVGLLALALAIYDLVSLHRLDKSLKDMLASLALTVTKLKQEQTEEEQQKKDAGKAWEEAINNLMSYELKGYGLNLDFLQKEDETNG
jgi:hypothetical protein